ncbi:DUF7133 domain-containing protein [Planctomicrobium sp. SH668]|uniref:DUF7133 domain-containing protein n=1 Tax=Planctomicrobium sp. SH668 TaxID=3448126 RepID=UPI003F5B49DA
MDRLHLTNLVPSDTTDIHLSSQTFLARLLVGLLCLGCFASQSFAEDWLIEGNLAYHQKTTASSVQSGHDISNSVDGDLSTRWCANGGAQGEWLKIDLAKPSDIRAIRIHWEKDGVAYLYRIETTSNQKDWKVVVDKSKQNADTKFPVTDAVDVDQVASVRITFLGGPDGLWGSIREVEISSGALPPPQPARFASDKEVRVPKGFETKIFSMPPEVNYPVCITAAATGEVFVGVDEQGSLGVNSGGGKIVRCVDTNNDGVADKYTTFAKVDHPRGLIYDQGSLWVLHPPTFSLFKDTNGDGVSDSETVLIDGISTADVAARGADHTTNGIQLGIDGWIYIAVGDYGVTHAQGRDGRVINKRGGGIIRVRPDGTDMEVYAWGLRNVLDACIAPDLEMFTRDNTNDGGEWNVRLSQIFQSAQYGYPSLYMNFREEIMPPLADYGGGSGCGGMFLDDARWPKGFNYSLYTCDWGRSDVTLHNLPQNGPIRKDHNELFAALDRPTDIDVDGSGRMYISSWKNGGFSFSETNVGYVARVVPKGLKVEPFPNLPKLTVAQVVKLLEADNAKTRLHAQLDLLRRGKSVEATNLITKLILNRTAQPSARIAAIFTLKQLDHVQSHPTLLRVVSDRDVGHLAMRALTDRKSEVADLPAEPFTEALKSGHPQSQIQAIISIGRLGRVNLADHLISLTKYTGSLPAHNVEDPARVIPHLAVRALSDLEASAACLNALNGPYRQGALLALRNIHTEAAVAGLEKQLSIEKTSEGRIEILAALIRLFHTEGKYEKNWWGTRPDRTGPYYDRQEWDLSDRVAKIIKREFEAADSALKSSIAEQLKKHVVEIDGLILPDQAGEMAESDMPIVIPPVDPNNMDQIANQPYEEVIAKVVNITGDAERGKRIFEQQSCAACHTFAKGQTPKGPDMVDITKRYPRPQLLESILKPSAKIAQGFETNVIATEDGQIYTGFVVGESADAIQVRQGNGVLVRIHVDDIDERAKQEISMMPEQIAGNLTLEQLADLLAYLDSLKS